MPDPIYRYLYLVEVQEEGVQGTQPGPEAAQANKLEGISSFISFCFVQGYNILRKILRWIAGGKIKI